MRCAVPEDTAATATTSTKTHDPNSPPDAIQEQLSASIAEINQPISAVVMNAEGALWLLDAQPTDMEAIRRLLACIVKDAMRTGDIVNRTRALSDRQRADERLHASEQRLPMVLDEMTAFVVHEASLLLAAAVADA